MITVYPKLERLLKEETISTYAISVRRAYLEERPLRVPLKVLDLLKAIGVEFFEGSDAGSDTVNVESIENMQGLSLRVEIPKSFHKITEIEKNFVLAAVVGDIFFKQQPNFSNLNSKPERSRIPIQLLRQFMVQRQESPLKNELGRYGDFSLALIAPTPLVEKCIRHFGADAEGASFFNIPEPVYKARLDLKQIDSMPLDYDATKPRAAAVREPLAEVNLDASVPANGEGDIVDVLRQSKGIQKLRDLAKKIDKSRT